MCACRVTQRIIAGISALLNNIDFHSSIRSSPWSTPYSSKYKQRQCTLAVCWPPSTNAILRSYRGCRIVWARTCVCNDLVCVHVYHVRRSSVLETTTKHAGGKARANSVRLFCVLFAETSAATTQTSEDDRADERRTGGTKVCTRELSAPAEEHNANCAKCEMYAMVW